MSFCEKFDNQLNKMLNKILNKIMIMLNKILKLLNIYCYFNMNDIK